MKQNTKSKTAVTGAIFLSLAAVLGMVSGNITWAAAGILGLAVLDVFSTISQSKPVLVRIRSQRKHS